MYRVCVQKDFIAQHYLIGADWGAENQTHSHHYRLELELSGEQLDRHNYLVDIVEIESALDKLTARYKDKTLNALPEFADTNPSLEFFARLICERLAGELSFANIKKMVVRLWENESAWAGYEMEP